MLRSRPVRRSALTALLAGVVVAPVALAAPAPALPSFWHVDASVVSTGPAPIAAVLAGAADEVPAVDWKILAGLDYVNGKVTDSLKKLEGKTVRIPGFVVPLDDFEEEGAEFLLVPYYGACVHTPPPPPNQIVFVQMAGKKKVKLSLFDAVWMHGKLKIASVESPYGTVGFTLEGVKMEPYSSR